MKQELSAHAIRRKLVALTVAMPAMLWVFGFLVSSVSGCDPGPAANRATVYALSWLAGWAVACGIMGRPRSRKDLGYLVGGLMPGPAMVNNIILEPKARPWPFAPMLRRGVLAAVAFAVVMGVILRGWKSIRKRAAAPEPG